MKKIYLLSITVLLACGDTKIEDRPPGAPIDTATVDKVDVLPDSVAALDNDRPAAPTQFDPRQIQSGSTIGGLKVAAVDVQPAPIATGVSGSVRFAGEVQLVGSYRPHFDYPEVREPCFWVNADSWSKLPRAAGDQRVIWFCFENRDEAVRQLGPLGTQAYATIVIDNYTTNLTGSDAWDTARLVRVVSKRPL